MSFIGVGRTRFSVGRTCLKFHRDSYYYSQCLSRYSTVYHIKFNYKLVGLDKYSVLLRTPVIFHMCMSDTKTCTSDTITCTSQTHETCNKPQI